MKLKFWDAFVLPLQLIFAFSDLILLGHLFSDHGGFGHHDHHSGVGGGSHGHHDDHHGGFGGHHDQVQG